MRIWHPGSDKLCRPLAERLYLALYRDAYQPLVPGIGIPVFFRCAGADPAVEASAPAAIAVPDTEYDLRVALLTPELALDDGWQKYLADNYRDVATKRDRATLLAIALGPGLADTDEKAVVLAAEGDRLAEQILQHVLLQACRLIAQRPRHTAGGNLGAAPLKLFLSHTKRDTVGLKIAQAVKRYLDGMAIDRFFDEVSIQPGDSISDELKLSIEDSGAGCDTHRRLCGEPVVPHGSRHGQAGPPAYGGAGRLVRQGGALLAVPCQSSQHSNSRRTPLPPTRSWSGSRTSLRSRCCGSCTPSCSFAYCRNRAWCRRTPSSCRDSRS